MIQLKLRPERSKNWYWRRILPKPAFIWIIILTPAILVLAFWRVELAFALLGVVLAAWTAYHAKVSHFLECFSRCNESYAKLNGLLWQPSPQSRARNGSAGENVPSDPITDYFNLCAEEYVMYKMGVIPYFVWDVWRAGIHDLALEEHMQNAWDKEKKKGCDYYGFDLEQIRVQHHEAHLHDCKKRDNCPWGQVTTRASLADAQ